MKYKKKKSIESKESEAAPNPVIVPPVEVSKAKKLAAGTIKLQFAGDLAIVRPSQKTQSGLLKRYTELFEALANMDKERRQIVYKFITSLALTSHARKATTTEAKRKLFEIKNNLFIEMVNDRAVRRLLEFKYLVSKNFRVLAYCDECTKKNTDSGLDRHKWKYCKICRVDHNFYNLLSIEIKFPKGFARMFLSNDQLPKLIGFKLPRRMKAGDLKEEAMFANYHYNSRNLDAINLDSVMAMHLKVTQLPTATPGEIKSAPQKAAARG